MEASLSIPMPQNQGARAIELADIPGLMPCQIRCFGRSVLLSRRSPVFLTAFLSVGMSVGVTVTRTVAYVVSNNTAIRGVALGFAGLAAGSPVGLAAGIAAGVVAERLYVKCLHETLTFSPAELTQVTGHKPDAIEQRSALPTDRSDGETIKTNNEAQSIKETTPPLIPPESDD